MTIVVFLNKKKLEPHKPFDDDNDNNNNDDKDNNKDNNNTSLHNET